MEVELLVDEVSLTVDPEAGGWEAAANTRIERIRKRNLTVSVGTRTAEEMMDPLNLRVEVTQLGHLFPFGTALKGEHIRSCLESGEDDLYCSFARENFNYVVLEGRQLR